MNCLKSKVVCIIQARLGSTRLPGKVFKKINEISILDRVIINVKKSKLVDVIVLASNNSDIIHNLSLKQTRKIRYFGDAKIDENDVLTRYYQAAMAHHADIIVRVTADCPLIIPELLDYAIAIREIDNLTYIGIEGVEGIFGEVFTKESLDSAYLNAVDEYDREHVTPYIRKNNIIKYLGDYKLSVDTQEDLEFITKIIDMIE